MRRPASDLPPSRRCDSAATTTVSAASSSADGSPLTTRSRGALVLTHNGMFPCFLGGRVCRLLASTRRALVTCTRVCDGGMTAST